MNDFKYSLVRKNKKWKWKRQVNMRFMTIL